MPTTPPNASPAAAVPEGWKLVPVEPTKEMLVAAIAADKEYQRRMGVTDSFSVGPYDHWVAMLSSSPAAPAVEPQSQWRAIETAPLDGTKVLGWNEEYGARETRSETYTPGSPGYAEGRTDRWWQWEEPKHNWTSSWRPTHWMPLPPAPGAPAPSPQPEPAPPYSAPFTTDVPQCCGAPETCNDPCSAAPQVVQREVERAALRFFFERNAAIVGATIVLDFETHGEAFKALTAARAALASATPPADSTDPLGASPAAGSHD